MSKRYNRSRKDNRLNLVIPRRNWKRFDSVLQQRSKGRTATISSSHQRRQQLGNANQTSNTLRESTGDGEDADALKWLDFMIKRGRSILSSLTEEERAFEQEIREEKRLSALHDRLVENILSRNDEDTTRNGYGTDTSFKNMNSTLYNSFVDSEDINLEYSRQKLVDENDVSSTESPEPANMDESRSGLHSDRYDHISEHNEQTSDRSQNASLSNSLQEDQYDLDSVNEDIVEVLSVTSQDSEISQDSQISGTGAKENSSSEEEWEKDEKFDPEDSFDGEDLSNIGRYSSAESAEEADVISSRNVGDQNMSIVDEAYMKHEFARLNYEMGREVENAQHVDVLSDDQNGEESNDESMDRAADSVQDTLLETEHMHGTTQELGLDRTLGFDSNQHDDSPSSSPASDNLSIVSEESRSENLKTERPLSGELEDLVQASVLSNSPEFSQRIKTSTRSRSDSPQNESSELMGAEDEMQHPVIFDYRAIAQEARKNMVPESEAPAVKTNDHILPHFDAMHQSEDATNNDDQIYDDESVVSLPKDTEDSVANEDVPSTQQIMESEMSRQELNLNNFAPDLIEVEINPEAIERQEEANNDNISMSSANETTMYHSFVDANDKPATMHASQLNLSEENVRYQIVFAESAYSTTSYEDNDNVLEPGTEYVSPLTENPFSIKQDEQSLEMLRRTLAFLKDASESQNGDDRPKDVETDDRKKSMNDHFTTAIASSEQFSEAERMEGHFESSPRMNCSHVRQLYEEGVSDYGAPGKSDSDSEFDYEISSMIVEEIESDVPVDSIPVIQTEPQIEVMDSIAKVILEPSAEEELHGKTDTIAEFFDNSDFSEDGNLNVVRTNPIIEVPMVERHDINIVQETLNKAVRLHFQHETLSASRRNASDLFKEAGAVGFSSGVDISDDQRSVSEPSHAASSQAKREGGLNAPVLPPDCTTKEDDNEIFVETSCARNSSEEARSQSFGRKLISSPLRAISSLVSGIKDVGNVASDFVRTLDVLNNEDSEETTGPDMEHGGSLYFHRKQSEMSQHNADSDVKNMEATETETLEHTDAGEMDDLSAINDSRVNTRNSPALDPVRLAGTTIKMMAVPKMVDDVEERAAQDLTGDDEAVSVQNVHNDIEEVYVHIAEDVKDQDLESKSFQTSVKDESKASLDPNVPVAVSENLSDKIDNGPLLNESKCEADPDESVDLIEEDGSASLEQSVDPPDRSASESTLYSPLTICETVSHIHTLQQLADNVSHMPFIQENQHEESELRSEEETPDSAISIEVDPVIEINMKNIPTDEQSLPSNSVPGSYPADSTLISETSALKTASKQGSSSPDLAHQEINRERINSQEPLCGLHDQVKHKLPSYLPSDPPSEEEAAVQRNSASCNNQTETPTSPASAGREDSLDCVVLDPSSKKEDIKNIPVDCTGTSPGTIVPVVIEEVQRSDIASSQDDGDEDKKEGNSIVVPTDREALQDEFQPSIAEKGAAAAKRKRARGSIIDSGRNSKRSKKQFRGKRKGKKKGPITRKRN